MNEIMLADGYKKIDFNRDQKSLLSEIISNSSLEALDSLSVWGSNVEKPSYNRYSFPNSITAFPMSGIEGSTTPYDYGYINQVDIKSGSKMPLRVLLHELGHVQNNRHEVTKDRSLNEIYSELISGMALRRLSGITKQDYDSLIRKQKNLFLKKKK